VAYARIGTIRAACEAAGIQRRTYYDWSERDEVFVEAAQLAKQEFGDRLEEKLAELSLDYGNVTSLIVALKMAGRFVETTRNEHTGAGGAPIQVSAVDYRTAIAPLAPPPALTAGSVGDRTPSS